MRTTSQRSAGVTVEQAMQIAVASHQAGRLEEAERLYRQVLDAQPELAEALHLLGLIACQTGRNDAGVDLIRRAIALHPTSAEYHNNFGLALSRSGRLGDAFAAYRRAIELLPDYAEAHSNLGNALMENGQIEEAIAAYARAIQANPAYPQAHYNLGNAFSVADRLEEAVLSYKCAILRKPDYAAALTNLGNVLGRQNRIDEAIAAMQQAIFFTQDSAEAYNNLGNVLVVADRFGEAEFAFQKALELKPDLVKTLFNIGSLLLSEGRLNNAIAIQRRACALEPAFAAGHGALIFSLQYRPETTPEEICREREQWDHRHAAHLRNNVEILRNDPDPERTLRVGYVSPDFRDHVVGNALLPCFEAHHRGQFEWFCYSGKSPSDAVAARFKSLANGWCETASLSDEALAAKIRDDRIDLLVDLSLHTAGNRLLMFAGKPAPIQLSWLGYPGTAGLRAIDYWISDFFLTPGEADKREADEAALRLPGCWCCYGEPPQSPDSAELPALRGGFVTFGSFNNVTKINDQVLALWARLLSAVEGSRLILMARGRSQERMLRFFEQRGIGADRLDFFASYAPSATGPGKPRSSAYLLRYQKIDIALDPFPYNGMTTTCDALWMGVPVVALTGRTPISRASFSLLSNVGLPELAASSEGDYLRIGRQLAGDLPRLAQLRATLREKMKSSPLLDAAQFARNLEAAFRDVWIEWCEKSDRSRQQPSE